MKKTISLPLISLFLAAQCAMAAAGSWQVLGPGGGGGQFNPTINPWNPQNVLVSCDMTGAYVTHDAGGSWDMHNFGSVVRDYVYDNFNPGVAYVASVGVFRTVDEGRTWSRIFPRGGTISTAYSGDHADPVLILDGNPVPAVTVIRPVSSQTIWLGHADGSVTRSRDSGESWEVCDPKLKGPVISLFPAAWWGEDGVIAVSPTMAMHFDSDGKLAEHYPLVNDAVLEVRGGSGSESILYAITESDVFVSRNAGKDWKSVASDPIYDGINFRAIAVSERNPHVAYLTCTSTPYGVFKTEDAGNTWQWVYKVAPSDKEGEDVSIQVGSYRGAWLDQTYGPGWREYPLDIGVSPTDPDLCYVTDFGSTYRTTDGGKTWEQVYSIANKDGSFSSRGLDVTTCYGIHFDPFDAQRLFISYTDIGAFYSEDGGKSWHRGVTGIPREWRNTCYWAAFDPAVQGRAWSVWGNKHDLPRDKMFRRGDFLNRARGGVATSTDGGRTWAPLNRNGIPEDAVCTHIVIDPNSPEDSRTLYVTAFKRGIYRSTDGGQSWVKLPDPSENQNYFRLAFHPDGALYAMIARDRLQRKEGGYLDTPGGLFCSRDRGETWEQVSLPEEANFPTELVWDPSDHKRLFVSFWPHAGAKGGTIFDTGGGVLASTDGGKSWERVFDQSAFVSGMAVHPADSSVLALVTFQGAAYATSDRGASWQRISGYDFKWGHHPFFDPHNKDQIYITTFGGSVWRGPLLHESLQQKKIGSENTD